MTTDETESQDNEKPLTEQESNVITFSWITRTGIYFGPPAYPLFHYTSLATFQKILESRKLWASHFRYLNDVTEFTYAVQVIVDRIEARQKESTYLQYAAKRVRNLKPTDLLTGPYVISFSENGDSLSQWRGYCSRMAGVSVGFSGGILSAQLSLMRNNIPGNETVYGYLVRCVYEREEQNARIDKLVDFLLESIKDGDIDDPSVAAHYSSFISIVPVIAPTFKDQAFSDEKEWRVIMHSTSPSVKGAKFRFSDSMLIPYLELPVGSEPLGGMSKAIQQVVIGPTPHEELSLDSVRRLVELQFGFPADRVSSSKVPYRHW